MENPEREFEGEASAGAKEAERAAERAGGDKQLHLAGAGTIAMGLLLVSLSVLFIASTAALLILRSRAATWPPPELASIHLPKALWLSTLLIIVSSVTMQAGLVAIRRNDEKSLVRWLWVTLGLGLLFLGLQVANWLVFYDRIPPGMGIQGPFLGMFYVLTGLHAAHVIGGLIPLAVVIHAAMKGRYSRNYHPGVRYSAAYWHFLDVVWVVLFCVLYF